MRRIRLLGLLVVWTLVAAACSPSSDADETTPATTLPLTTVVVETTTTTTATVAPGEVRVGEGSTVDVPAGPGMIRVPSEAVSGSGTLVVESVAVSPPEGFEMVGGAFDVSLDGTDLSGVVEFSMAAPRPPPGFPEGVPTAWLATFDDAAGSWVPIETVLVAGRLVAEVDHFSWYSWITPDLDWLGDAFLGMVESVLGTGLMDVAQPVCDGEAEAIDAGVDVASDDGSSTMWCVGVEDDQTVLKVTNNRRYSVGINTPDGFEVVSRDADSGTVEFLTQHSERTFGFDVTLSRGETVVFSLPDGASGLVVVEPSPATFLLEVLSLEVDFAASVLAPEGAVAKAIVGKCLGDIEADLFGEDVQGNVSAAFSFGFACLSDSWTAFFPSGWMVKILWGFVSSTIRLIVEGLVGSISGIVDTVSGIFDGSDVYRISIVMPQEARWEAAAASGDNYEFEVRYPVLSREPLDAAVASYARNYVAQAVADYENNADPGGEHIRELVLRPDFVSDALSTYTLNGTIVYGGATGWDPNTPVTFNATGAEVSLESYLVQVEDAYFMLYDMAVAKLAEARPQSASMLYKEFIQLELGLAPDGALAAHATPYSSMGEWLDYPTVVVEASSAVHAVDESSPLAAILRGEVQSESLESILAGIGPTLHFGVLYPGDGYP